MKRSSNNLQGVGKIFPDRKISEKLVVYLSLSLLFIISAAYFYWFGNGIFSYQENKSLFIFSGEYLLKFAIKPGGLLVYAANFLTQGYYNSLYGSFLLSTLLILLSVVVIKIDKRLSADRSFSLLFILLPSCLLLLLQTHYDLYLQYSLGYLLVTLWFLVSIVPERTHLRFIVLAFFPLFLYLVGSFAFIYLGMYIMYSLIYGKGILRYILPAFLIVIVLLTFIVFKEALFLQPFHQLLCYPFPFNDIKRLPVFLYLPGPYLIIFPLFRKASGFIKANKKYAEVISSATVLTVFSVILFSLSRLYDPVLANVMQLENMVYKQDWDAIIKKHERVPSTNVIGQYYYNLALSEKGQLCNRLFFGRQDFGPMSLTLPRDNDQAGKAVYFYYTIGLISETHHLAYELMVKHGYRPENIKLLIKTELINGNYRIAERYINVLKKTLHYKGWAEKYEKMLYKPNLINADPELGEKIRMLPKSDFFIGTNDVQNIELLLSVNPDNKRAFEYKIARMLLEKDLMAVGDEVKKMKGIGYTSIPRHIEEALVVLMSITKELPDLGGLSLNPGTGHRFMEYKTVYSSNSGNKSLLEKKMNKAEKNTFWYYLQFVTMSSYFMENNPENNSIY